MLRITSLITIGIAVSLSAAQVNAAPTYSRLDSLVVSTDNSHAEYMVMKPDGSTCVSAWSRLKKQRVCKADIPQADDTPPTAQIPFSNTAAADQTNIAPNTTAPVGYVPRQDLGQVTIERQMLGRELSSNEIKESNEKICSAICDKAIAEWKYCPIESFKACLSLMYPNTSLHGCLHADHCILPTTELIEAARNADPEVVAKRRLAEGQAAAERAAKAAQLSKPVSLPGKAGTPSDATLTALFKAAVVREKEINAPNPALMKLGSGYVGFFSKMGGAVMQALPGMEAMPGAAKFKRDADAAERDSQMSGEEILAEERQLYKAAADASIIRVIKRNNYEGNWIAYLTARMPGTELEMKNKMTVVFKGDHWEVAACACDIPYKSERQARIDAAAESLSNRQRPIEVKVVPY